MPAVRVETLSGILFFFLVAGADGNVQRHAQVELAVAVGAGRDLQHRLDPLHP